MRLLPAPPHPITPDAAEEVLARYEPKLLDRARDIADAISRRGHHVYFWTLLTPGELVHAWPKDLPYVTVGHVHYAPSATQRYDSIQLRIDKATGAILVWDGQGILDEPEVMPHAPRAEHQPPAAWPASGSGAASESRRP